MHCPICDREDDISFNKVDKEFGVCVVCQIVIDDCIAGYPKLVVEEVEIEG